MNPTEYIMKSARTDGDKEHYKGVAKRAFYCAELVHYTDGLVTESGEIKDMMKKHIAYGAPLDFVNLKEELGDICWYIARMCDLLGWTFEELMELIRIEWIGLCQSNSFDGSQARMPLWMASWNNTFNTIGGETGCQVSPDKTGSSEDAYFGTLQVLLPLIKCFGK